MVLDDDLQEWPQFVDALRTVVHNWPLGRQRAFCRFVCGVAQLPAPGTEKLVLASPYVVLRTAEHRTMLQTLPVAHACTNTLELPNYLASMRALNECGGEERAQLQACTDLLSTKLVQAMDWSTGYSLDTRT
ncbi:MAG: hypothetical protein EOO41_00400 [Methanobacteriota archaeon]|nr:MAG: hypothetical protein EOO41_00400 [Euryarchaeota archaeon]